LWKKINQKYNKKNKFGKLKRKTYIKVIEAFLKKTGD
jgi:hypothetical protein